MKELVIVRRVLSAFQLQSPVPVKTQKLILSRKKEFLRRIRAGIKGQDPAEKKRGTRFRFTGSKDNMTGGIMKTKYAVGIACAVAIIAGAGIFFAYQKHYTSTHPFAEKTADPSIQPDQNANVVFVIGDVSVKRGSTAFVPLKQGERIVKNDVVRTGKKSNAVIQIGDIGVMKILENTEFTFRELKDNGATEAYVSTGGVYSKISKLEKNNSYRVKTPTAIAAVRGTQFLTRYEPKGKGKSEVQVLDGKVSVKPTETNAPEKIAGDGKGVTIEGSDKQAKETEYKLTQVQNMTLQKYSTIEYIDDLDTKSTEDLMKIRENSEKKEKEIDVQLSKLISMEERVDPLDRLRKQGKPLTMVYLRDGSQIAGSVVSADEKNLILDTGEGSVTLPVAEILRRLPIK